MDIASCIVTYNPDYELLESTLHKLKTSGCVSIVIDNTGTHNKNIDSDILIYNYKNFGLGKAYNQCLEIAKKDGYEWLLLLDQDSRLNDQFNPHEPVQKLAKYQDFYIKTAILSINKDISTKILKLNDDFYLTKYVVGSGSMLEVNKCYSDPFLENLFLYSIDIEYSVRMRKKGYFLLSYSKQMIDYTMGQEIRMFKRRFNTLTFKILSKLLHKDLTRYPYYKNTNRYYLMLRNDLYLLLRRKVDISYVRYIPLLIAYINETDGFLNGNIKVLKAVLHSIKGDLDKDNLETTSAL
ncbi:glycosyl transferase family 2 [Sulfolobales archaeon HS-7]|nr:glycosyl transferase family 2 [Sulfolobales archaeon HS-7]